MKKTISLVIALVMAFGILMPVGAKAQETNKIELKQAIENVKNAFGIDTANYNFDYNYDENNNNHKTYDMNWNSKKAGQGGISASVDAETGDVLRMYRWSGDSEQKGKIPVYTKAQALASVKALCTKIQPLKFKEMELKEQANIISDDTYSTTYTFNFVRKIKGIEFDNNGIEVSVDKNTLKVTGYNFAWNSQSLPDASKVMDSAAAKKIFSEKMGLELSYNLFYRYEAKQINPSLVYSLKNGLNPIDATTGEILNNSIRPYITLADKAKQAAGANESAITPEEQSTIDDASKYITKEKAIETAQKYLPLDSSYKLTNSNLYRGIISGSATWNFSWTLNDNDDTTYGYMSAVVDAVKGEIRSFSMDGTAYEPSKDATPSYKKDAAKTIAENFVKGLYPTQFSSVEYKDTDSSDSTEKPQGYNFNYVRKYNNAACPFDYIRVYVNAYTGKVQNFTMNWSDVNLPSTDGVIGLDKAYSTLYGKSDLKLKYIEYYDNKNGNENTPQIRLAYVIDNYPGLISAKNGNFVDSTGSPIKERKAVAFTDIKGNAAENSINILNQLGFLDEASDKFMPNTKITQKDFVKMLMLSTVSYYDIYTSNDVNVYDRCYELAIQKKIITESEKKPDAAVTRQDASKMVVKALGIGFVANLSNIYNLPLKDIKVVKTAYKGYIAISAELKILVPTNGYFYPTKELTRGDTAIMLVNYLKVNTAE